MPYRGPNRPTTDPRKDPARGAVMRTLGEELLATREHLDMTQTELGDRIGITKSQISKIEKGENNVNIYEIFLIWEFLQDGLPGGKAHPLVVAATHYLNRTPRRRTKPTGGDD